MGGSRGILRIIALLGALATLVPVVRAGTPMLQVTPDFLDFGPSPIGLGGSPRNLSMENTGNATLAFTSIAISGDQMPGGGHPDEFAIIANTCSAQQLAPGEGCVVTMQLTAGDLFLRQAELVIELAGQSEPIRVYMSGNGQPLQRELLVQPAALDFGDVGVGQAATAIVELTAIGNAPLVIDFMEVYWSHPEDFEIVEDGCSDSVLQVDDACSFEVRFVPSRIGPRDARIDVFSNATTPNGTPPILLDGVGLAQAGAILKVEPPAIDFDVRLVGELSASRRVLLANIGTDPLEITGAALLGDDGDSFLISGDDCSGSVLESAAECEINLRFQPQALGVLQASLGITSTADNAVPAVALSGEGVAELVGAVETATSLLDYGVQVATTSSLQSVEYTNSGGLMVTVQGVSVEGPDAAQFLVSTNTCGEGQFLPIGQSCTVVVRFQPPAAGLYMAELQFDADAAELPDPVALLGEAIPVEIFLDGFQSLPARNGVPSP